MKRVPDSAASSINRKKTIPQFSIHDFRLYPPCWRIGHFDVEGKWGISSLLGDFVFSPSNELELYAIENDDILAKCIDNIRGKHFRSVESFWNIFTQSYGDTIPADVVKTVASCVRRSFFLSKIYPKLQSFENSTWDEIDRATHDNGISSNHNDSVEKLSKEAQDRLAELHFSDRSEIYSLRLENQLRIFGFREMNYLDIIWIDTGHKVYPSTKKHT